jgi:predicted DCC family thiol-disulfide oxidoreductase YuxK
MDSTLPARLVIFDGVCGLCDRAVQFFLEHDKDGTLRFTPLQGETARRVLEAHPELVGVDSVIFVEREGEGASATETVYVRSKAVFRVSRYLDGSARALRVFSFLPQAIADVGYDFVASVRYKIFGKLESCRIPSPEVRARFLP